MSQFTRPTLLPKPPAVTLVAGRIAVFGRPNTVSGVRLRPLTAGSLDHLLAVFDGLSPHSRYQRYHQAVTRLTPRMVRALLDVEPGRHEVIGATRRRRPVGLARWIRDRVQPARAELAVEVVDAVQGRGIGRALVTAAARSAREAGVTEFECYPHPANPRLADWLDRLGGTPDLEEPGAWRISVQALAAPKRGLR